MSRDSPWIAVVDDEESVCKALRRLLQSAGLAVETFAGGGEFLDSLGVRQPDCVVLDLNMPDVSGYDVLARLAEADSRVPVIVLTGNDSVAAEERCLRAGAFAFLRKPINASLLLDAISAALAHTQSNTWPNP